VDRGNVEYDIDACDAQHNGSETGVARASLLSLTIYDTDKKVVVHCQFVLIVIGRGKERGNVGNITGHGGEMEWRRGRSEREAKYGANKAHRSQRILK